MDKRELTELDSHFAFGENWREFSSLITEERANDAVRSLARLFPEESLAGHSMLDIGCGSGLSMLSALRLGVRRVDGIDLDPASVETADRLLSGQYPSEVWSVKECSVFELESASPAAYDIVYSWGVLHHTGSMWRAIKISCSMVRPDGRLCIALYRRTPICGLWSVEKRLYSRAPTWAQKAMRVIYKGIFFGGLLATGRSPSRYLANYKTARGMDWHHDVHDWLGGYPYESVTPEQVGKFLKQNGFVIERSFEHSPVAFGLFGSHCDEFVARRVH